MLDRKDIRTKLEPDMHEALARLADMDGSEIGEFVGRIVVEYIESRVHDAIRTVDSVGHLVKSGQTRELPGMPSPRRRR